MQIGEFLVKLGVVTDVSKVEKFSKSLAKVGAVAGLAVGTLNTAAAAAFSFLDGEIRKTEELAKTKNGLISISKEEIALAKEYQDSTKKLTGTLDLLKNKLALGVAPQMLSITERMNGFLLSNKKLITDGLQKVVKWLFEFAEGTISVFRSLGDLIDKTVGWKNALFILIGVLALVKKATIRAFIVNPITWVMVAIAGLILLIDDLMTYMRGGKSLFGDFWDPFIKYAKIARDWWKSLSSETQGYIKTIGSVAAGLKVLTTFVPGVGKAFKFAFSMAARAVMMLSRVMITNPIIAVIMAIAAAAYYIYKNWDDLPGFFSKLWAGIVDNFLGAVKSILTFFGMTDKGADDLIKSISNTFKDVTEAVKKPFQIAFDWVRDEFGWLLDTLEDGFKKLKFWEDDDTHDGPSIGAMVGSNLAMQQAAGGSSVGGGSKVINGGDMKVDINVKDNDTAQVVKSTVERSGNKMAQANAQLAGGF